MALVKLNARDLIIEVEDVTPGTYVPIAPDAITGVTVNRGENEEVAPTVTYGSGGQYEQHVMQRGATMAVTGFLLKDDTTAALDPGQARVEALGALTGAASVGTIRFRYPDDTEWKVWSATVSLGESGGETNAKTTWAATFTRCGASTTEVVVP